MKIIYIFVLYDINWVIMVRIRWSKF